MDAHHSLLVVFRCGCLALQEKHVEEVIRYKFVTETAVALRLKRWLKAKSQRFVSTSLYMKGKVKQLQGTCSSLIF